MPLSFLMPFMLGAAAFAVVPWVLHHIRRPERKPVTFSSLMFVPDVKKEVIERRRLQHLLLMLLRIAVLLLLAFAFARPFLPRTPAVVAAPGGVSRHVIAIDVSYSMAAAGVFDAAKEEAFQILDGLNSDAQVAVIAFGATPRQLAALSPLEVARRAVEAAQPTLETTAYEPALRLAGDLLTQGEDTQVNRAAVHFISDFQEAGMPEATSTWRLPPQIEFDPVNVPLFDDNTSVFDLHLVETTRERLHLRAKIKNWSPDTPKTISVQLAFNGSPSLEKTLETAPRNASQVTFELPAPDAGGLQGWVEIDDPSFTVDNRRYFTWNPQLKRRVLIVGAPDEHRQWPVSEILRLALAETLDGVWTAEVADTFLAEAVPNADVVVVADSSSLTADDAAALTERLANGGSTLIILGAGAPNETLLPALGLSATGPRFEQLDASRFVTFSWVDFKHPVFSPFADSRFNDFSDVHFYNHHILAPIPAESAGDMHALARFEPVNSGDGTVALVAASLGKGRAVAWAFDLDFEWTNLAKTARFVPLLHESLVWLTGGPETPRSWLIGQQPTPPRPEFEQALQTCPGEESRPYKSTPLHRAGFLEWHANSADTVVRVEPVNVDASEGDPTAIAPAEFALRLCSSPVLRKDLEADETIAVEEGGPEAASWEYGRLVFALILAALFSEIWYAGTLR